MPHADVNGIKLYYEEAGSGTPLLFLHEFAGDHRSWEDQMRFFARRYRAITFSARGYPPSDVPEQPELYGQDHLVEDARGLLDAVSARKVRPLSSEERDREANLIGMLTKLDERISALSGRDNTEYARRLCEKLRRERESLEAAYLKLQKELEEKYGVVVGKNYELV